MLGRGRDQSAGLHFRHSWVMKRRARTCPPGSDSCHGAPLPAATLLLGCTAANWQAETISQPAAYLQAGRGVRTESRGLSAVAQQMNSNVFV